MSTSRTPAGENPQPSDELMEATIDAALRGDTEDFATFNAAFEQANKGRPVGKRGKRASIRFGDGSGSGAYEAWTVCPDCGLRLASSGFSFVEFSQDDHEAMMLENHRMNPFGDEAEGCPQWAWRRAVYHAFTDQPWLRRVFTAPVSYAWKNLDWNHPVQGPIYRVFKWWNHVPWWTIWRLRDLVGLVEQPYRARHPDGAARNGGTDG